MSTRSSPGSSAPERSRAFAPVAGPGTRLLILGSLPGVASLAAGQYYAHPRNAFWRLTGVAIGADLVGLPYEDRLAALRRAGVGLWDVIASAERAGSLDAAIRHPERADLAALIATLPRLQAVAFNGAKAGSIGRRQIGAASGLALIDLPSSSPAHAIPFEAKLRGWSTLAAYVEPDAIPG